MSNYEVKKIDEMEAIFLGGNGFHAAEAVDRAHVSRTRIGRAAHARGAGRQCGSRETESAERAFGATSIRDPDAFRVEAPCRVEHAFGVAQVAHERDAVLRVSRARVPLARKRKTRNLVY